jgi:hypothetical protein
MTVHDGNGEPVHGKKNMSNTANQFLSLASLLRQAGLPNTAKSMEFLARHGITPLGTSGRSKVFDAKQLAKVQEIIRSQSNVGANLSA